MIKMAPIAAAVLLAACGSQGGASQAARAQTTARSLDVAGLRVGMPAKEAEAALKAGGWSAKPYLGDSWRQAIDKIVARQRGQFLVRTPDAIGGWNARKGDETLEVSLHPTPDGGAIDKVIYRAPVAGRTSAEFRSELTLRYGPPSLARAPLYRDGAVWCSAGDPMCIGPQKSPRLPYLTSAYDDDPQGAVALILAEGSAATHTWEARRDAAVAARSGGKGSF